MDPMTGHSAAGSWLVTGNVFSLRVTSIGAYERRYERQVTRGVKLGLALSSQT